MELFSNDGQKQKEKTFFFFMKKCLIVRFVRELNL